MRNLLLTAIFLFLIIFDFKAFADGCSWPFVNCPTATVEPCDWWEPGCLGGGSETPTATPTPANISTPEYSDSPTPEATGTAEGFGPPPPGQSCVEVGGTCLSSECCSQLRCLDVYDPQTQSTQRKCVDQSTCAVNNCSVGELCCNGFPCSSEGKCTKQCISVGGVGCESTPCCQGDRSVCDAIRNRCINLCENNLPNYDANCISNSDCCGGLTCSIHNHKCGAGFDGPCRDNSDCDHIDSECDNVIKRCTACVSLGSECTIGRKCCNGISCGSNNRCGGCKPIEENCGSSTECCQVGGASVICNGKCKLTEGGECQYDSECNDGLDCIKRDGEDKGKCQPTIPGICRAAEQRCTKSDVCCQSPDSPYVYKCLGVEGSTQCIGKIQYGATCSKIPDDCDEGLVCITNGEEPKGTCQPKSTCIEPSLSCTSKDTCCNDSVDYLYKCIDSKCIGKKQTGVACASNDECDSGKCENGKCAAPSCSKACTSASDCTQAGSDCCLPYTNQPWCDQSSYGCCVIAKLCGNGCCDGTEDPSSCPADCPQKIWDPLPMNCTPNTDFSLACGELCAMSNSCGTTILGGKPCPCKCPAGKVCNSLEKCEDSCSTTCIGRCGNINNCPCGECGPGYACDDLLQTCKMINYGCPVGASCSRDNPACCNGSGGSGGITCQRNSDCNDGWECKFGNSETAGKFKCAEDFPWIT